MAAALEPQYSLSYLLSAILKDNDKEVQIHNGYIESNSHRCYMYKPTLSTVRVFLKSCGVDSIKVEINEKLKQFKISTKKGSQIQELGKDFDNYVLSE